MSPLWSFLQLMKPRHKMAYTINNSVTGDSPSAIQNGAIFFSRLNIFLFNKMLPVMINFLNERVPNAIDLLVNNLDLQPISELLYRFYAFYNGEKDIILEWLRDGKFYDKLADQMVPKKGSDLHTSVAQFIKGLFSLPFPDSFPRDQVLLPFLNQNWLNRLLGNIFTEFDELEEIELKEEMEQSAIVNGIKIISTILRASVNFHSHYKDEEDEEYLGETFISNLIENFETFFDILKREKKIQTFGRIRLEIVEMFLEILNCLPLSKNCELFVKKFKDAPMIPFLLDAFFYYHQNSILHDLVVKIIREIFTEEYEVNPFNPFIDQLMKEYNLRQRIVDAQRENDVQVHRPRGNRLAYMGHLTLIAECVINWETNSLQMSKSGNFVVSQVPEESWREFSNKTFKETRMKDRKVLGGIKPPVSMQEIFSSSEDSADELLNYNSVFRSGDEEQLARYFCQQLIGNFPEQFLYADEHSSEEEEDDSDDDMEIIFQSHSSKGKQRHRSSVKSIEIPILMQQDDFDEEMFDSSFTSSLLSDSEDSEADSDDSHDSNSDDDSYDSDDDYEM